MVVPNYILNLLSSLKCCLICSIFEVPTSTYFILKFIYTTLYIRYISSMLVMCNGGDQRTTITFRKVLVIFPLIIIGRSLNATT